jgi:Na+/proline symporter
VKVGGWQGLVDKVSAGPGGTAQVNSWPGTQLTGFGSAFLSVVGLVFGLGFVLSFGYWTTNFVEVQRAMASRSMSAARRTPIIGAFPKMFVPFIVIIPGMVAGVSVAELAGENKAALLADQAAPSGATFNNALLLLMRDLLPNGMLGVAIAGLLASFMAGMAANLSSFNTVFTYDIWQHYLVRERPDGYYLGVGRVITVLATVLAIGTAFIASGYANLMDYLQQLFSFFNAPLFATFAAVRHVHRRHVLETDAAHQPGPAGGGVGVRAGPGRGARAARPGRGVRRRGRGLRRRRGGQRGGNACHATETGARAGRVGVLADAQGGPAAHAHRGGRGVVPEPGRAGRNRAGDHGGAECRLLRVRGGGCGCSTSGW